MNTKETEWFERITPEEAGISSRTVAQFINRLEKRGAAIHGMLMMRKGKLFAESYWAPFSADFRHRMYSETKSFVGVAVGLLVEEGKLSLDDVAASYFPDKCERLPEFLGQQTIREMLTMSTAGGPHNWFTSGDPDRTHFYLNDSRKTRPSGTLWEYDSSGSQVLCALVERLSGKPLLEYLKEKIFNHIGTFRTAEVLKAPNGDSWGDSAMVCTLRDIASFGQFVMNYGTWNGKRLMNEAYLREATSAVRKNASTGHYSVYHQGYGYQIWQVDGGGFAFVGMGDQFVVCYPEKEFLFACESDNQGCGFLRELMLANLQDLIVEGLADRPLPPDPAALAEWNALTSSRKLFAVKGEEDSAFRTELDGTEYVCRENPMGWKRFSFRFDGKGGGELCYTNAQGDKALPFGVNRNEFGKFPQYGYSDEFGGCVTENGFLYNDAVSMAWLEEKKILLYVQIIDRYFGNLSICVAFKDDYAVAQFTKTAENFLGEYEGTLIAEKSGKTV